MRAASQRRRSRIPALLIAVVLLLASLSAAVPASAATTWEEGDIFLGGASATYQVRASNGALKDTLTHDSDSYIYSLPAGCAFDDDGNFYGSFSGAGAFEGLVTRFAAAPPHVQGNFVVGDINFYPQDIAFDESGNLFVGTNDPFLFDIETGIYMYDPSGAFIRTITRDPVASLAIAIDGDTILYTHFGNDIKRVSISTGAQLPDFTTGTATSANAVRVLQDGTVLLADWLDIKRYDATGTVIQTYDIADEYGDEWFRLALDPDGETFWAIDYDTGIVHQFDIATGAVLDSIDTDTGFGNLNGICIKGEPQAYDAPQYYEACLYAGSLSKVSYIGISSTPTVSCGRGTAIVLHDGDDYQACLYAGSLSQVGTTVPTNCGRGEVIGLGAGDGTDDLHGCRYAGSLSQLRFGTPPSNCGRGVPISLGAGPIETNGTLTL